MAETVAHYLSLPYTVILQCDDEGDVLARIVELKGCLAHGNTHEEALKLLREIQTLWIEESLETGQASPMPVLDDDLTDVIREFRKKTPQ